MENAIFITKSVISAFFLKTLVNCKIDGKVIILLGYAIIFIDFAD